MNKVVLAYSGGLDTSVILRWLQDHYGCEVVTFTADLGQGAELEYARQRAVEMGVREVFIEDLREEFVRDYVFPMFRGNAVYEGEYLLGTAIARPLICRRLVEIASETGADAVAHGATGKGNDQTRFELGVAALAPELQIIAPWREWSLKSREDLLDYCQKHGIDTSRSSLSPRYSVDVNLLHASYEGWKLEDPWQAPEPQLWQMSIDPQQAPDEVTMVELEFRSGDLVAVNGSPLSPAQALTELNRLGGENGIGRLDIVENRYVGMKSRGCYETPGGTILLKAHRALESLTLDREVMRLKDDLLPRYAALIYNGYWWSPERELLQGLIDQSQRQVNGKVSLALYKGSVTVCGRASEHDSLFDEQLASFSEDGGVFSHRDAAGFIHLNALRLRMAASRGNQGSKALR